MSRNIWVKKINSFSEEYNNDLEYYTNMSSEERIELVQFLREQYLKINGIDPHESGKGLRRAINIIQQA